MKKNNILRHWICKRLILVDSPGQTCNRFWSYLDSVAWAIANNKKVVILHWDSSISSFDSLRNDRHVSFPFHSKVIFSVIGEGRWIHILHKLFNNSIANKFYGTRIAYWMGFRFSWPLRKSHDFFPLMKKELRPLFRPNEELCMTVDNTMSMYRSKGYFIIGVHIRRGDYKTWEGGQYYYEYEEYAGIMRSLVDLYKDCNVAFFISTNERYKKDVFNGFKICQFDNKTAAQDLYTLSLCDRIIGPLSTFSRWASWYGNVPLAFIEKGMTSYKDSDFSIIKDFYHFENGNEIINLSDR